MEVKLLASYVLDKCEMFGSQLTTDIEAFLLHMVMTTYVNILPVSVKAECWTLVQNIHRVFYIDMRKVQVE